MKKLTLPVFFAIAAVVILLSQCKPDETKPGEPTPVGTPYDFKIPEGFPQPFLPSDNPMTVEGVDLGHHLFYDKRLSGNITMSCASCHHQAFFFADLPNNRLSKGIDGIEGRRNAMPLFNLAWQETFFWDGRVQSLEEQSLHPIKDPIELNTDLETVISRLQLDSIYPDMFKAAFGDKAINADRIAKALAQFERTIISSNSKFDRVERLGMEQFTAQEARGLDMFNSDFTQTGARGGDCFHCHGAKETGYLMGAFGATNQFKNNGNKATFPDDKGRMEVTNDPADEGKFKVPSVRNMEWTFPYMHDGSIADLNALIEFYSSGIHVNSPNLDPNMTKNGDVDKKWTQAQKDDLKAFLETLTDDSLRFDPAFQDPFSR